jgi:hypothetical protein
VKLRENKAIHNSASGRPSRTKLAVWGMVVGRIEQLAQVHSIRVFFLDLSVPVVQRTEQGFPKGKTAFFQEFADVISSAQIATSKRVE